MRVEIDEQTYDVAVDGSSPRDDIDFVLWNSEDVEDDESIYDKVREQFSGELYDEWIQEQVSKADFIGD